MRNTVQIVEVGPRDGFQSIAAVLPLATKLAVIEELYRAGVTRMETTSFVSTTAVPQLSDASAVVAATKSFERLDSQVLVPTARQAERALTAGAEHLCAVLSVSERHNRGNVRRTPQESVQDYSQIVKMAPKGTRIRLNVATAFHCPYQGLITSAEVLALLDDLVSVTSDVEIALCDTTGRANPGQVSQLFKEAFDRFPGVRGWAFHAHDTYGLGAANVLAAWHAGVNVFDASAAGLGGCPFAPGATGNVATEDLVWMFEEMGIGTGIDVDLLVAAACTVTALPGAQVGGRVRNAFMNRPCVEVAS